MGQQKLSQRWQDAVKETEVIRLVQNKSGLILQDKDLL